LDQDQATIERDVATIKPAPPQFELDIAWRLHPEVSIRPGHAGVVLYHFGTRRRLLLKSRTLLRVLRSLDSQRSARTACVAAGVAARDMPAFTHVLERLAASSVICRHGGADQGSSRQLSPNSCHR
jgi:putative mycofactocin binding protein MftB